MGLVACIKCPACGKYSLLKRGQTEMDTGDRWILKCPNPDCTQQSSFRDNQIERLELPMTGYEDGYF